MKSKIVYIYEGIDHTGKSTAAVLQAEGAYRNTGETPEIFHTEGYHENTLEFYDKIIGNFKNYSKCNNFIFDRAMIGELVYGPLWRKESRISLYDIRSIFKRHSDIIFIININYVKHDNLGKYLTQLIIRDNLEKTMSPQKAMKIVETAWIEQCMFKSIISAIKMMDLPNVIINEGEFVPGGQIETI